MKALESWQSYMQLLPWWVPPITQPTPELFSSKGCCTQHTESYTIKEWTHLQGILIIRKRKRVSKESVKVFDFWVSWRTIDMLEVLRSHVHETSVVQINPEGTKQKEEIETHSKLKYIKWYAQIPKIGKRHLIDKRLGWKEFFVEDNRLTHVNINFTKVKVGKTLLFKVKYEIQYLTLKPWYISTYWKVNGLAKNRKDRTTVIAFLPVVTVGKRVRCISLSW